MAECDRSGVAFLQPAAQPDLLRSSAWKRKPGEVLAPAALLFLSNQGRRPSLRWTQTIFAKWQRTAGFDLSYNAHALRHTAITNVHRETRAPYLAQRFARHSSAPTTTVYTHVSDEEM